MPSYPTRKTKSGTVTDVRFRIIDDNGQEVQKRLCGFPNKRAAQQAYLDFMKTYTPPIFQANKDGVYMFDDLFAIYLKKTEVELAPSSYYDLISIFNNYISPYFQGKSIDSISKSEYSNWLTELWAVKNTKTGKYYSQNYLTKIRSTFMTFLTWCEDTYDTPNILKLIKKPKRKERKTEMQFWTIDEFSNFQTNIGNVLWKTFFMSLFYSGCRIGELLALTDKDIKYENGYYSFVINKGITRKTVNHESRYLIVAPKNESSNRVVTLPKIMTEQISRYINYKNKNDIAGNFFFGGTTPIRETTYRRYFDKYTAIANLKRIRIHDLRHSHASMLIHLNVPISVISKRLGHSTIEMTLKKYAHCYPDDAGVAIEAINAAISATISSTFAL